MPIIIKMVSPETLTFNIKNQESFIIDLDMATLVIDMPESAKEDAEAIKLAGNILKITIVFLLNDYTGSVATLVDELTGVNAILTVQEQIDFLLNRFENKSLLNKYELSVPGSDPPFLYPGVVDKITFEQSKETADKYRCTISFSVANVITVSST